jgi:hypothetical protein
MTQRVWVVDYTGRLGNRLKLLTHLSAAAVEYGFQIANPAFWKYRQDFQAWKNNSLNFFPGNSSWPVPARLERLSRGIAWRTARAFEGISWLQREIGWLRCRDEENVDLSSQGFRNLLETGPRNLLMWGYNFHAEPLVRKHRGRLLELFRPRVQPSAPSAWTAALHIRRSDYRQWAGGQYHFSWESYRDWARQIFALWANESPRVLVFSDEPVPELISKEPGVEVCQGSPAEDLFRMVGSKIILGPPSSFSDWAAWYGGAGRLRIEKAGQELRAQDLVKVEVP